MASKPPKAAGRPKPPKAAAPPAADLAAPVKPVAPKRAPAAPKPVAAAAPRPRPAPKPVQTPVKAAPAVAKEAPPPVAEPAPAPELAAAEIPAEPIAQEAAAPEPEAMIEEPTPAPVMIPTAAIAKETTVMETTMKSVTDKTQSYFAEANTRAKTAMEKGAKMFEDMNEFGKGNIEALVESGKIAAKGIESLGQEAAEYSRKSFEGATAALKSLSGVKSPTDFFKLHSDYVRSSFDSLVAETSKSTEAMLKLAGEVAQPISNRVAVAVDKAKIAA